MFSIITKILLHKFSLFLKKAKILSDMFGIYLGSTPPKQKHKISITKKRVGDTIFVIKRRKRIVKKRSLTPTQSLQKHQAKIILNQRLQEFSVLHNLPYARSFIRDQKSKWGSCTRRLLRARRKDGVIIPFDKNDQSILCNISLNRRLTTMPDWIRDYVILHELAHTKYMNHSKDFRGFLDTLYPKRKEAQAWLKLHGIKFM